MTKKKEPEAPVQIEPTVVVPVTLEGAEPLAQMASEEGGLDQLPDPVSELDIQPEAPLPDPNEEEAEEEVKATPAVAEWPKFLRSATGFGYTDPDTKIRYGASPVRVDAAPKAGSWLHCQMQAKYIVVA